MEELLSLLTDLPNREFAFILVRALLLVGVGLLLARLLSRVLAGVLSNYFNPHQSPLFLKD